MEYRYLETTGALNEAGSGTGRRIRPASAASSRRSPLGVMPLAWRGKPLSRAFCDLIPESLAREDGVFPVGEQGETLVVAALDHDNIALADKLTFVLSRPVHLI